MAHIWSPNWNLGNQKYIVKNGVLQKRFSISFSGCYTNWETVNNYPKTGLFEIHTVPNSNYDSYDNEIATMSSNTNITFTGFSSGDIGKEIYIEFDDTDELIAGTCFVKSAGLGGLFSLFGVTYVGYLNANSMSRYNSQFFYGNKSSYPNNTSGGTSLSIGSYYNNLSKNFYDCSAHCMSRNKIIYIGTVNGTSFTAQMTHVESDNAGATHKLYARCQYHTPESDWSTTSSKKACYTIPTFVRFKNLYLV